MTSVWVLFAAYSENGYQSYYTYFKGVFKTHGEAKEAQDKLHGVHPEFNYFVKEVEFGKLYDYGWTNKWI
jgi:hypothetical protein